LDGSHTKYAKSESPKQFGGNTYDAPALRYGGSGRSENKLRPVVDFFRTTVMKKLARMRWQRNLEDPQHNPA
jgi:hypothetical protein